MSYSVYIHTNKVNGKRYVGVTTGDPEKRWRNGLGYKTQFFYKAIEKYGWDNFDHFIIEVDTPEQMYALEKQCIEYYQTTDKAKGYNMSIGGEGGGNKGKNSLSVDYIKNYKKEYYNAHREEKLIHDKEYRLEHKEELKMYHKKYRDAHREEKKEYFKRYREEHSSELKEKKRKYQKEYYENHKEEIKEYQKEYHNIHKEEIKERQKQSSKKYYKVHPEKLAEKKRRYYEKHKEQIRAYKKRYYKEHK